jgi:hypothetical protein
MCFVPDPRRRTDVRVFVCSPFRGQTSEQQQANVEKARQLLRYAVHLGHAPFAPHLLYPGVLNDADPVERVHGIEAGLSFLLACHELWWLETPQGITEGMRKELQFARPAGLIIRKATEAGRLNGEKFDISEEPDLSWLSKQYDGPSHPFTVVRSPLVCPEDEGE